ncbi:hypothetical protein SUDANB6_02963 [Streptomyces sp. enrichment culture]|uniref:copper chaperone PCu(A)C n=1 Tax=Streptomyces sp. enrichment culture TaxID=1795815 RepID=UPI003F564758
MRRPVAPLAAALGAVLLLAGCGADGSGSPADLSVSAAYMPQPVSDSMAAGFLTLTNEGGTQDELTSVTSDLGEVTVHETAGGVMRKTASLAVPAHGRLVLESGGNHLMFEKLKHRPKEGEKVSVELHFAHSDPVRAELPVKPATYRPSTGH